MRAGELRHRITIEQKSTSSDGAGGRTTSYSTLATVWAAKEYESARDVQDLEADSQMREGEVNRVRWTIRHRDDVDDTMRVSHDGNTYDIRRIEDDGRDRWLYLYTRQVS